MQRNKKNMEIEKGISTRHNPSVRSKASTAGITLVALVVTIIVLIILATISINIIFGDEGILERTLEAQEAQKKADAKEKVQLMVADYLVERETSLEEYELITYMNEQVAKENLDSAREEIIEGKDKVIVKTNGYEIEIDVETLEVTVVGEGENNSNEPEEDEEQVEYSYMTTGLKLYLDGENNTGNGHDASVTSWKDLSGNENDGTLNGGTWTDNGLSLDGIDDWVNLGYHDYGNYTLEVIYEVNGLLSAGNSIAILGNWHTGGGGIYGETDNKIFADFYINGEYDALYADTTSTNTKYKVTITSTGKEQKMYVNGELVSSSTPNGVIEIPNKNTVMAIRRKSIKRCYSESISFRNSILSKNI